MNPIELLSPAGDLESLQAAVSNGADSVYFGGSLFNARSSAKNFEGETLQKAIQYAKLRNVRTHLTLNTLLQNTEWEDAIALASEAYHYGIDAIIVQDLGLAMELKKRFPDLPLHASTQMSAHNLESVLALEKLGFQRVVLSRELSLPEIAYICKNTSVEIEVFIHGALCISYSGQCLFSSTIGGRSGNRGKCAQPCRLPYTLYEDDQPIDNGYLLSTRDLMGIEYLAPLLQAGVSCFKIEGRMKSPEYVATVTRIYRHYLDKALQNTPQSLDPQDKTDLMQVFHRGGFSDGHLSPEPNRQLVFPDQPHNMGLYLGNIAKIQPSKGLVTLDLNEPLAIGDTVRFEKEKNHYTVSELIQNGENIPSASSKMRVTIGRMKGNLSVGDKLYKMSSKALSTRAKNSYSLTEEKKFPLDCTISIHKGEPVRMRIFPAVSDTLYQKQSLEMCSAIYPETAVKTPLTKERVIAQLSKTTQTPYVFRDIQVDLEEGLHLPSIAGLNELRRQLLTQYEETFLQTITRPFVTTPITAPEQHPLPTQKPSIALLLADIQPGKAYATLPPVAYVYIPFHHFLNPALQETLQELTTTRTVYLLLPTILKANFKNLLLTKLDAILQQFSIQGFVLSSIGDIELLKNFRTPYHWVGNFTLNICNTYSLEKWKELGLERVTLSPELSKKQVQSICSSASIETEVMVYGNYPIMNMSYCLLGKTNRCYPTCPMPCKQKHAFYLEDRMGFHFPIVPDRLQTVTTIYNAKTLFLRSKDIPCSTVRVIMQQESIEEMQTILACVQEGNRLEGPSYTNGNFQSANF